LIYIGNNIEIYTDLDIYTEIDLLSIEFTVSIFEIVKNKINIYL